MQQSLSMFLIVFLIYFKLLTSPITLFFSMYQRAESSSGRRLWMSNCIEGAAVMRYLEVECYSHDQIYTEMPQTVDLNDCLCEISHSRCRLHLEAFQNQKINYPSGVLTG